MEFLNNLSTLEIVGIIVLLIIFGGALWRIAKGFVKLVIVAVIIFGAIYFIKPELLNEWFGSGTTAKIEQTAGDLVDEAKPHVVEGIEKIEPLAKGAKEYLEDSLGTK